MFSSKGKAVFHKVLQTIITLKIKYQRSQFHAHLIKARQEINNRPIRTLCHQGNMREGLQLIDIYRKKCKKWKKRMQKLESLNVCAQACSGSN